MEDCRGAGESYAYGDEDYKKRNHLGSPSLFLHSTGCGKIMGFFLGYLPLLFGYVEGSLHSPSWIKGSSKDYNDMRREEMVGIAERVKKMLKEGSVGSVRGDVKNKVCGKSSWMINMCRDDSITSRARVETIMKDMMDGIMAVVFKKVNKGQDEGKNKKRKMEEETEAENITVEKMEDAGKNSGEDNCGKRCWKKIKKSESEEGYNGGLMLGRNWMKVYFCNMEEIISDLFLRVNNLKEEKIKSVLFGSDLKKEKKNYVLLSSDLNKKNKKEKKNVWWVCKPLKKKKKIVWLQRRKKNLDSTKKVEEPSKAWRKRGCESVMEWSLENHKRQKESPVDECLDNREDVLHPLACFDHPRPLLLSKATSPKPLYFCIEQKAEMVYWNPLAILNRYHVWTYDIRGSTEVYYIGRGCHELNYYGHLQSVNYRGG